MFSPTYAAAAPAVAEPLPDLLAPPSDPLPEILEPAEQIIHVTPLAPSSEQQAVADALILTQLAIYCVCPVAAQSGGGGLLKSLLTPARPKVRANFQQWRHDSMDITRLSLVAVESVGVIIPRGESSTAAALCASASRSVVPHAYHFPSALESSVAGYKRDGSSSQATPSSSLCFWLADEVECRAMQAAVRAACAAAVG